MFGLAINANIYLPVQSDSWKKDQGDFSKISPCTALIPKINAILKKLESDGTLEAIYSKYLEKGP